MAETWQRGVTCKRGHDEWMSNGTAGKIQCYVCRTEALQRRAKHPGPLFGKVPPQARGPLGVKCARGHDDWSVDKMGRKRCHSCQYGAVSGNWAGKRRNERGRWTYDTGSPTTLLWDTLTYSEVMAARKAS